MRSFYTGVFLSEARPQAERGLGNWKKIDKKQRLELIYFEHRSMQNPIKISEKYLVFLIVF